MTQDAKQQRPIARFSPAAELTERHPDWTIHTTPLPLADHIICWKRKAAWVDPEQSGDADWVLTHVLAHLDQGEPQEPDGPFAAQLCASLDGVAKMYLGMDLGLFADPPAAPVVVDTSGPDDPDGAWLLDC